jgi:hypothetical protein
MNCGSMAWSGTRGLALMKLILIGKHAARVEMATRSFRWAVAGRHHGKA